MKLVWSHRAIADLQKQCNHIARDRPRAAVDVQERVFLAAERLARFPMTGSSSTGRGTRGRFVPRTGLTIVYTIGESEIVIVTVRHQMRKPFRT